MSIQTQAMVCGFIVLAYFAGAIMHKLLNEKKYKHIGTLKIDTSDPADTACLLVLNKYVGDYKDCDYVILKVDNNADLSQEKQRL